MYLTLLNFVFLFGYSKKTDSGSLFTNAIIYCNNRVDVRGHKYVFGPTQTHFSPSAARVKMSSEKGQNIFMPKNINLLLL